MKKLLSILLIFASLLSFGQGDQTIIQIPGVEPAILHLPPTYYSNPISYPLLVFLHGKGEGGTNPGSIYTSSTAGGPAYFIAQNKFPSTIPFIVVSPQFNNTTSGTSSQMLDQILLYLIKTYNVDVSRIYLTGLSEGGMAVANYLTHYDVKPSVKIAAAVIMSANIGQPSQTMINQVVSDKVNLWGFGSMTDVMGIQTRVMVQGAFGGNGGTLVGIGSLGKFTTFTGGHCCWNQFYDPAYTEGGLNIYQWMQQFSTNAVAIPPVVVAPGIDSSGIIKAYLSAHPCPTVDSLGIGKAYLLSHPCPVCPPPVVCPVCPAQRTAIKIISDLVTGISSIVYSDGTTIPLAK